jgi:hypothetical protein
VAGAVGCGGAGDACRGCSPAATTSGSVSSIAADAAAGTVVADAAAASSTAVIVGAGTQPPPPRQSLPQPHALQGVDAAMASQQRHLRLRQRRVEVCGVDAGGQLRAGVETNRPCARVCAWRSDSACTNI